MRAVRRFAIVGVLAALVMVAPGCAKKFAAERDGKDIGESLCDVRQADTKEEATSALQDLNKEIDDVAGNYSLFTAEDRKDIEEQVSDLVQHQGDPNLAQQDITVIRRSLENIKQDLGDTGKATIDGIYEGLDDCDNG
jgi:hypothetical protein